MYNIWNQKFTWKPKYGQVKKEYLREGDKESFYFTNSSNAPLIEFSRSDIHQAKYGRIYWAKYFSAPYGLDYDVKEFSKWYDIVVNWIRRNSAGKIKEGWTTWFLPDAWNSYMQIRMGKICEEVYPLGK